MTDLVGNITEAWRAADDDARAAGAAWYSDARREAKNLARETGITWRAAAGIIAAASLNQSWKGNLTIARRLARGERVGLTKVQREADLILCGRPPLSVIAGPKRRAFYRNICGATEAVTVDRWAARAAGAPDLLGRVGGYDMLAAAYRAAADLAGVTAPELQAVVWCHVRGSGQ